MANRTSKMHLEIHQNAYRVRRIVPKDIRPVYGKGKIVRVVGKVGEISECKAHGLSALINEEIDALFASIRAGTYKAPPPPADPNKRITVPIYRDPTNPHNISFGTNVRLRRRLETDPPFEGEQLEDGTVYRKAPVVTFTQLIEEWARKKRIDNPRTRGRMDSQFEALAAFLGHNDALRVTPPNIIAFERHLEAAPDPRTGKLRHPNTVNGYMSNLRGVFNIGVQQLLLPANPMEHINIAGKVDSTRQAYSVAQVTRILQTAKKETYDIFLPLLTQAYSGMRIGEIVDWSTKDFNFIRNGDPEKIIPDHWFLYIGEDNREPGRTTKGHKRRYVPLHPEVAKHLIPYMEQVRAAHGDGPLFPLLPKAKKDNRRSTYVARKIDDWMDGVLKDPNLAPNHSFRHYLKSQLLERDVPERISDSITGHKTPGTGRKYEHVEMSKKFEAIAKLPVTPLM